MVKNTNQIFARAPYEAPSCEVLRVKSEGIVCASVNSVNGFAIESFTEDGVLDF